TGGPGVCSSSSRLCVVRSTGSAPRAAFSARTGRYACSRRRTPGSSTPAAARSARSRTPTVIASSARTRLRSTASPSPRRADRGADVQAYGMALDLRDDAALIARYKKEHAQAWPAVLARLREIGVTEMKIFLLGRRMFMYCETRDGF